MGGNGDYLSLEEIASILDVTVRTLARWCVQGYLPGVKFGRQWRVLRSDFDEWRTQHHSVYAQPSRDAIKWPTYTKEKDHRSSTHKYEREMRYAALALDREIDEKLSALLTRKRSGG